MGVPGTSILNQAQMLELALEVKPKVAYLSFYAGNDLLDLIVEATGDGNIAASELRAYDLKTGPYSSQLEYQELWDSVRENSVQYLSGVKYSSLRGLVKSMGRRSAIFRSFLVCERRS